MSLLAALELYGFYFAFAITASVLLGAAWIHCHPLDGLLLLDGRPVTDTRVWVCLGMTDEFHQFCPFATRDEEKAKAHGEIPGHWCRHDVEPRGLWAECLSREDVA